MYAHESPTVAGLRLKVAQLSQQDIHSCLDEALLDARMTVQAICAMKNTYSTINNLPEELFTKILCYCIAPADTYKATSWKEHVSHTLVCKHWRETLLSFPGYWACIAPLKNKHLSEMLARSQNALFSLRARWEPLGDSTDGMEPLEYPAQHYPSTLSTERLEELHILAFGSGFLLDRMPTTPTPVLRSIRLEGIAHGFPPHVLTVPKPALQSLYLGEMEVPWEEIVQLKPTFPALRTFEISGVYTEIAVHHLLQLLSSMKKLETLFFYDAMLEGNNSLKQASAGLLVHVRLDHLSKLYVKDTLSNCTMLMSHLTFPVNAEASVDFAGDDKDWTAEEVEQEMNTLISSFPEPQFSEPALSLSWNDLNDLEIECQLRSNTSITLGLSHYKQIYIDALTIPGATTMLFMETSRDPEFRLLADTGVTKWVRLLARHPGIERVELVANPDCSPQSGHMRLVSMLSRGVKALDLLEVADIPRSQQHPLDTAEPELLLPALDHLHLTGMLFEDGDFTKLKKAVKSILELKGSSFHFVLELEDAWGFTKSMFKELKAVSPQLFVKWDHIVGG